MFCFNDPLLRIVLERVLFSGVKQSTFLFLSIYLLLLFFKASITETPLPLPRVYQVWFGLVGFMAYQPLYVI